MVAQAAHLAVDPAPDMSRLPLLLLLLPPRVPLTTAVACDKTSPVPWCMPYDTCVPGPSFGLDFSCYRTQGGISAQMIQGAHTCHAHVRGTPTRLALCSAWKLAPGPA